ncbi:MAG TPA: KUP/HAK/KT family potassium transporter, partial [Microvirga sp.]|nr:KUP/HAK/KT family potassium transporter [Microvirga sp.]
GIVALLALLNARQAPPRSRRACLVTVGLIGAAMLYGDGAITPAISVLSAVEGIAVDAPRLAHYAVPATVVILVALFAIQRRGTAWIGGIFGPVILVWFIVIGALGIGGILRQPGVLAAINPALAAAYLVHASPGTALAVLGGVFLVVTGGEALYADLGHFGRFPIRVGWFAVVLPGLVLNYFGQGALVLTDPAALENPFYQLAPEGLHYPLIALATLATVIASQAVITGAYSLTQQSIQLGFLPRMRIVQTAGDERGQIYVPFVNWLLAVVTVAAVIGFGSSSALAGAYGLAVSLLMVITTILAAVVALGWGWGRRTVYAVAAFFLVIDLAFLAANSLKLLDGGWFPLLLAVAIAVLMLTWRKGRQLVEAAHAPLRLCEADFLARLKAASPPVRVSGTAVFLTAATSGIPRTLVHHLQHNRVLHERVYLVSVVATNDPRVPYHERTEVTALGCGIRRLILRFGFMETPDVPWGMGVAKMRGECSDLDLGDVTYYLGRETVIATPRRPGMALWREIVFAVINQNAQLSAAYFHIPASQVIEIGIEIEI